MYLKSIGKPTRSSLSAVAIMLIGQGITFRNINSEEDRLEMERNKQWFIEKEKKKLKLKLED